MEIKGISLDDLATRMTKIIMDGVELTVCIGNSLNTMCRVLLANDFTSDEDEWKEQHSSSPPFLMILLGPTAMSTATHGWLKEEGDRLSFYDNFNDARLALKKDADNILPRLQAAFMATFSDKNKTVYFIPKDTVVAGRSTDGRWIDVWNLHFSASVCALTKLEAGAIEELIQRSCSALHFINQKSARFYSAATNENDGRKKFLLYFLAIEASTQRTFKAIEKGRLSAIPNSSRRELQHSLNRLRIMQRGNENSKRNNWESLGEKFIACLATTWSGLDDEDVNTFYELKKVRDDISHGRLMEPKPHSVNMAERLATKVMLSAVGC